MGAPRNEATGLFFVHVLDELTPYFGERTLDVSASHQNGKIPDVDPVLIFEVDVELFTRHLTCSELGPGPMHLALHDLKQRLLKLLPRHGPQVCRRSGARQTGGLMRVDNSAAGLTSQDARKDLHLSGRATFSKLCRMMRLLPLHSLATSLLSVGVAACTLGCSPNYRQPAAEAPHAVIV